MRINLNIANSFLVYELEASGAMARLRHDGGDLMLIELPSGESVEIHLVERDIDLNEVTNVLTRNTKADICTLFILWCDMLLPEDGQRYRPYDWMSALLTAYGDRIYAYDLYEERVSYFPVYFEEQSAGLERLIHHEANVDFARLRGETIHADGPYLQGVFRVAGFDQRTDHQDDPPTLARDRNPMRVFYDLLGVDPDANAEDVRKAYRQLARAFHPDVNKLPEATARMQQINTAYAIIMEQFGGE
jgi:hypothetical protein